MKRDQVAKVEFGRDDNVVKVVTKHNHPAQAARPATIRLINEVKERATTTRESPQQIIGNVVAGAHANVSSLLPKKNSMKKLIRRAKQEQGAPALLRNVEELEIPESYQQIMIDGEAEQFLFYDSEHELLPGRILIFSTRSNLHILAESKEWFADGTFSTAPTLFEQVYTMHVVKYNAVFPVELKRLQPVLRPTQLMTDFEQAALSAFNMEFPGITKTGCFFHLQQSVWRKVQSVGLKCRYESDREFARWIKMIPVLALISEGNVSNALDELVENEEFLEETRPIANYFEDVYIGRRLRRGRQIPAFPTLLWNVYQRTLNDQHRTNNHVEGWHRGFQQTCQLLFPNIYISVYSVLERTTGYPQLRNCAINLWQSWKCKKQEICISTRVKRIAEDYQTKNVINYLRGIAFNFEF
ncbi:hypothetical protein RN001_014383 [Aquatica leii]|uniref:MULE transposase domain-containing protein n=1 Tax=Aquatica leii TaxID=1421715 RepID=A0AAN7SBJ5_9COLE|nr:hypothetical protein RN001_014383 [Aquatica leii]